MSDNKKYYYMRLKENFFDSPELKTIESMRGGYKYSNILLKLYLLSLRDEGRLTFRKDIPYDINMLSNLTGFSKTEVENALKIFQEFNLIDILDTGTIYMLDIQNLIGKSSTEADRQRDYQSRINNEKRNIECKKSNKKSNDISTPETETETETETHAEKETKTDSPLAGERAKYFEVLWKHYPKKKKRELAEKAFSSLSPDREQVEKIYACLKRQLETAQWREENGRYVPCLHKWLEERPWENEPPSPPRPYEGYKRFT